MLQACQVTSALLNFRPAVSLVNLYNFPLSVVSAFFTYWLDTPARSVTSGGVVG